MKNGQKRINDVIDRLLPLYKEGEADEADSILGHAPNSIRVIEAQKLLVDVMLPGRMSPQTIESDELHIFFGHNLSQAWALLRPEIERALPYRWIGQASQCEGPPEPVDVKCESARILQSFYEQLSTVRQLLVEDIRAAYDGDPAALNYAVVQLAYPGLLAITAHRLAHELHKLDVPIVPRIMSEFIHSHTGVDIHPGAEVGHGFFIDHATGVVIGETSTIGNNVKVYQGVTLGAKSFPLDENGNPIKHIKRHPTVGDNVVIYAHATVLGDITIGKNSTIGGNVFLMKDVPDNSFVASKHPELHIKQTSYGEGI